MGRITRDFVEITASQISDIEDRRCLICHGEIPDLDELDLWQASAAELETEPRIVAR